MPSKIITGTSDDNVGLILGRRYEQLTEIKLGGPFSAIGIYNDFEIIGVIIFTNYNNYNIDIHAYAPNCFNRTICNFVLDYVFNKLNCTRLTNIVHKKNFDKLGFPVRMGFKQEAILKKYFGEQDADDGVVLTLFRENIPKWVKLNERTKSTQSP